MLFSLTATVGSGKTQFKVFIQVGLLCIGSETFFLSFFFFNVYLFTFETQGERQSMSGGGAERKGDAESEAGSRL